MRQLPRLRVLNLHATRVTDAGMASLAGLKDLQVLSLIGTRVGDAGLASLRDLPALRDVTFAAHESRTGGWPACRRCPSFLI